MAEGPTIATYGNFIVTDDTKNPTVGVHHYSVRLGCETSKNGDHTFLVGGALKENALKDCRSLEQGRIFNQGILPSRWSYTLRLNRFKQSWHIGCVPAFQAG